MKLIRIGSRESKLAVVQAQMVADSIRRENPGCEVELVTMKTTGDKILDRTLDKIGGKGLFVKELDQALHRGEVDLCVHSYKDMPAEIEDQLPVVAVGQREDARDVLILPQGQTELDPAQPVGCSSLRRRVQLTELFPGSDSAPVRGNVITRLQKLDSGEFGALVLAAAGIKRLDLWHRVSRVFSPEEMLPAGCQGALAVQGRRGEDYSYLAGFHNPETLHATTAERAFVRTLDCGCCAPVGVYAQVSGETLRLRGMIADSEGIIRRREVTGHYTQADQLGCQLATEMLERREEHGG